MPLIAMFVIFLIGLSYIVYLMVIFWRTKVPYVVTPKKYFPKLLSILPINSQTIIFDLGSGKGDFIFAADKLSPQELVGYELSPFHVWFSKIKAKYLGSRAVFYCQDFFTADLGRADIIYLFLVRPVLDKLWPKLRAESKDGAWIVVLSETLPEITPIKIIDNDDHQRSRYYIYQIKK